ncbi:MAG: hypothetical protein AB9866_00035 [Syntrophobacteraceae bacterium]
MSGESGPGSTREQVHWELWRQDDNGVRVLIARFEDQEGALRALAGFESQHHKQTYWVEEKKPL